MFCLGGVLTSQFVHCILGTMPKMQETYYQFPVREQNPRTLACLICISICTVFPSAQFVSDPVVLLCLVSLFNFLIGVAGPEFGPHKNCTESPHVPRVKFS